MKYSFYLASMTVTYYITIYNTQHQIGARVHLELAVVVLFREGTHTTHILPTGAMHLSGLLYVYVTTGINTYPVKVAVSPSSLNFIRLTLHLSGSNLWNPGIEKIVVSY